MSVAQKFLRVSVASVLLLSLTACMVAPAYPPGYYRAQPAYVETYPAYGYPSTSIYYESGRGRHYDDRGGRYYGEQRRYEEPRRIESPVDNALRMHRDVRRSLGLPRLPGMP